MATISFEVPEAAVLTLADAPDEFGKAVRLAAAMFWYGRGEITMGTAAAIAGLDLRDFLTALSQHGQDIFITSADDLRSDLATLAQRRPMETTGG